MKKIPYVSLISVEFFTLIAFAAFGFQAFSLQLFSAIPAYASASSSAISISGSVQTNNGVGQAGVAISFEDKYSSFITTDASTDGNGQFSVSVPASDYAVCMTPPANYDTKGGVHCVEASSTSDFVLPPFSLYPVPIISINGDPEIKIHVGTDYIDDGATAIAGRQDLSADIVTTGEVATNTPGVCTITYSLTDPTTGIKAVPINRVITVVSDYSIYGSVVTDFSTSQTLSPAAGVLVSLYGASGLNVTSTSTDAAGAYVLNAPVGDYQLCITPPENKGVMGGNSCSSLSILDMDITMPQFVLTSVPQIQLNGSSTINLVQGSPYQEEGARAQKDGRDLTRSIQIVGNVNTNNPGTFNVVYNVLDPVSGLSASTSRLVTVQPQHSVPIQESTSIIGSSSTRPPLSSPQAPLISPPGSLLAIAPKNEIEKQASGSSKAEVYHKPAVKGILPIMKHRAEVQKEGVVISTSSLKNAQQVKLERNVASVAVLGDSYLRPIAALLAFFGAIAGLWFIMKNK